MDARSITTASGRTGAVSFITGLAALVAVITIFAATIGAYPISLGQLLAILAVRTSEADGTAATILLQVRLPRIAAALVVGASLAAAGTVYQGLSRNPLVSPDILGVSTGAGLGAVMGIFLSLPLAFIQLFAFIRWLATVGLVYAVASRVRAREPVLILVLAGVVVGSLAGAMISLLKVLTDPYEQLPAITFWLLGSLAGTRPEDVLCAIPAVIVDLVPLVLLRWRINVLSLGDEEARMLGIQAGRVSVVFVATATLTTASVVAISGVIGWVGRVIPHIARIIVGPNFDRLLPPSMLLGAGYLLLVDTLARTVARAETPLRNLTAILGATFFLWLLARRW